MPDSITHADLWVQFHNVPVAALNEAGLIIMAKEVGMPLTPPMEGFVGGKRFIKFKLSVDITKPLKDEVTLGHPTLGDITMHCVYERISRICKFC